MAKSKLIGVRFEVDEFERKFPEISARTDLSESDKVRLALGRWSSAGTKKDS